MSASKNTYEWNLIQSKGQQYEPHPFDLLSLHPRSINPLLLEMNTNTPRTDACPHCGECDCEPYYRPHGQECRSPLCEMTERAKKAEAEVERLQGQLTRAVSIAGVLLADIEDFHEGDSDDEWTRNGWNDSRISKSMLQKLIEEMTNNSTNTKNTQKDDK